jgi:hypothetical protein
MKLKILILIILIIPNVLAISTDLKQTYQPQETIIIKLTGNIRSPISNQDIELRRNHILVPFEYNIKKISGDYYLWGISPLNKNNYTLHINDVQTTFAGSPITEDFKQNFTVQGDLSLYSLKPGFFIKSIGEPLDFTITLNSDQDQEIESDFPFQQIFNLSPGVNQISLQTINSSPGFRTIQFGIFSIPVLLIDNSNPPPQSSMLSFFPTIIQSKILIGESQIYPIRILNEDSTSATNIQLNFNTNIFEITPSTIPEIQPNSSFEFNVTLKTQDQDVFEIISFSHNNNLTEIQLNITYTQNLNETGTPYLENVTQSGYFCSELSGDFCKADETCTTELISAKDGQCCTGKCQATDSKTSSLAWIGWILGIVVLIILIWVFIKYKKSKSNIDKTNPLDKKIKLSDAKSSPPIKTKLDLKKST